MATNTLKKMHKIAKDLRKQHPKMTYQDALKKAGKQVSGVAAKPAAKKAVGKVAKAPVKKVTVKVSGVRSAGIGAVEQGHKITNRIDQLEGQLKNEKIAEMKTILKIAINKEHAKLNDLARRINATRR